MLFTIDRDIKNPPNFFSKIFKYLKFIKGIVIKIDRDILKDFQVDQIYIRIISKIDPDIKSRV